MHNDDLALCLWAHDVWGGIYRKPLEIETWVQRTTNRKWPIPSPMVTWPMTSLDPERSRSWPQYVWCPLSWKPLEIATWWQRSACGKWPPGNRVVTWPMTSRDPERSRSWPQYVWCPLSRKLLEIETWWQWSTYRKWPPGNRIVTWRMTSPSRDLKCQKVVTPIHLEANILKRAGNRGFVPNDRQ